MVMDGIPVVFYIIHEIAILKTIDFDVPQSVCLCDKISDDILMQRKQIRSCLSPLSKGKTPVWK